VIPIAGTVNVARIQALHKAVALELENEDWFIFGRKVWDKKFQKTLYYNSKNTIKT
jgi:predicted oxidoreductase